MEREERPWGRYEVLEEGDTYKVKRIEVDPGKRLSLQSHKKRNEYWVVVKGPAGIVLDDEEFLLEEGKMVYSPIGAKHRLFNTNDYTIKVIEIQYGTYFGEDDIIRYEDDYKRV